MNDAAQVGSSRSTLLGIVVALGLAGVESFASAAMIEWNPPTDPSTLPALVTTEVVSLMVADHSVERMELTDEQARLLAKAAGVELPRVESSPNYERPWFILKAGIGLPNLVSAQIEIFVHRNWTVSFETGAGLLPSVHEAIVRWRPDATCWGCEGKNFFSLGFGVGPGFYSSEGGAGSKRVGVLVTSSLDALYIHRFAQHFGFSLGASLDVGLVKEFYSGGDLGEAVRA